MIDRERFFRIANKNLFNNKINASQRAGITLVLDEWERRKLTDTRKLGYMLGTDYHETARTMQPVIEAFWMSENWRRENLRYYPYYGRGLPQLTWERNYRRMTELLRDKFKHIPDFDLVKHPEQALIPEVAVAVMFEGMLRADSGFGDYTGKSLEDYFDGDKANWIAARYVVNGQDKAVEIAEFSKLFWNAIEGIDAVPKRILHYGIQGDDVLELQKALMARGYDPGAADGDFGPATERAVKEFQRNVGIDADGKVGSTTLGKLKS